MNLTKPFLGRCTFSNVLDLTLLRPKQENWELRNKNPFKNYQPFSAKKENLRSFLNFLDSCIQQCLWLLKYSPPCCYYQEWTTKRVNCVESHPFWAADFNWAVSLHVRLFDRVQVCFTTLSRNSSALKHASANFFFTTLQLQKENWFWRKVFGNSIRFNGSPVS